GPQDQLKCVHLEQINEKLMAIWEQLEHGVQDGINHLRNMLLGLTFVTNQRYYLAKLACNDLEWSDSDNSRSNAKLVRFNRFIFGIGVRTELKENVQVTELLDKRKSVHHLVHRVLDLHFLAHFRN